ncbi:glutamine--fructose-6-phosphate transaminase (isomerizing) [Priestia aryabhattai]|uniref:Glutamine--fructose-6-phosphate aminotransferase [isomerizing] n=1 Tax=Priestia aryabhattai TaxID=412384 RepID=A0AAX6NCQ2_PRIAR|nr:glutamine--fructose-6-phosphate transaminase (isomerizing) [Priestia aryabhattai]MDU9693516.1 glutamine--fructose-6-phosphate transaminase (isomerizing) [Priestia aryabhattai]
MCGIVGYIGYRQAQEHLIKGLSKLEYRGYDSAGIATIKDSQLKVFKEKGKIEDLKLILDKENAATAGIGHTRWATHGPATTSNAHPHTSRTERFVLVHNGIVENYKELKEDFLKDVEFRSETDTEVIVHLVEKMREESVTTAEAFQKTLNKIEGSYAIAMIDLEDEETVYVAKNKSPLLIGKGNGENMVASDAMAVIHLTDQFIELEDKEMAFLTKDDISHHKITGEKIVRAPFKAEIDPSDLEKGTYQHYMLKETDEQPAVIRQLINTYALNGKFEIPKELKNDILASERLYIVACGTSYHAGLVGKKLPEKLSQIPTEVHISSEFTQDPPMLSDKSFVIFLSQSGETADSREALQMVKKRGIKTLTITNVRGSTLSREANHTLLLYAGPEIAVASTKAYTAQVAVMSILADVLRQEKNIEATFDLKVELSKIAQGMERMVDQKEVFAEIAKEYLKNVRSCFFIGRTMDYNVCLEGALKLKEISYIQAEGFAGGELKHGTIALIEEGTPVIVPITSKEVNLMIRGNIQEVNARGANSCILAMEGLEQEGDRYLLPKTHPLLSPLLSVVPMQLISYYAALQRDCDIDKPRNLAKSVTVL